MIIGYYSVDGWRSMIADRPPELPSDISMPYGGVVYLSQGKRKAKLISQRTANNSTSLCMNGHPKDSYLVL